MSISPNDVNYVNPRIASNEIRFEPTPITQLGVDITAGSRAPTIRTSGNVIRYLQGEVITGVTLPNPGDPLLVLPAGFEAFREGFYTAVVTVPLGQATPTVVRLLGNQILVVAGLIAGTPAGTIVSLDGIIYISE